MRSPRECFVITDVGQFFAIAIHTGQIRLAFQPRKITRLPMTASRFSTQPNTTDYDAHNHNFLRNTMTFMIEFGQCTPGGFRPVANKCAQTVFVREYAIRSNQQTTLIVPFFLQLPFLRCLSNRYYYSTSKSLVICNFIAFYVYIAKLNYFNDLNWILFIFCF